MKNQASLSVLLCQLSHSWAWHEHPRKDEDKPRLRHWQTCISYVIGEDWTIWHFSCRVVWEAKHVLAGVCGEDSACGVFHIVSVYYSEIVGHT